jgi:hypothetical protein
MILRRTALDPVLLLALAAPALGVAINVTRAGRPAASALRVAGPSGRLPWARPMSRLASDRMGSENG